MRQNPRRMNHRAITTVALVIALAISGVAPIAGADDPAAPITAPPPTTTPVTSPPTTVAATTTPSVTQAPTTTAAGSTSGSSTTSTTSTAPTTTIDPATVQPDGFGYATTPAPLIPSSASDPLFHAALTVDDDMRNLDLAKIAYLKSIAAHQKAKHKANGTKAAYDKAHDANVRAAKKLASSQSILRAAALHAYAGFGSAQTAIDTPQTQGDETVLPYRTYVRVTISDATRHVSEARDVHDRTKTKDQTTSDANRSAKRSFDKATATRKAAKNAVADAEEKLERDQEALAAQISVMPDLALGTLDKLPEITKLPPGAIKVMSPAGTIVVPATADPRTAVALQFIIAQLGKPYLWGGTGPNSYDCSGLMLRAYQAAGVTTMPRVSQGQQVWATPVDAKDAQPGDLVFFGRPAYHVGVYIGGGLMMDAPYTGSHVRVDRVWKSVTGYGRVVW